MTGFIEAKSSIASPIQEALRDPLKITENHNGRVAITPPFRLFKFDVLS